MNYTDSQIMLDAYHAGDLRAGLAACERLDNSDDCNRDLAHSNKLFYIPSLSTLLGPLDYRPIEFGGVVAGWSLFNPSVLNVGGALYCNIRSANYGRCRLDYQWTLPDGSPNPVRSDQYFGHLGPDGQFFLDSYYPHDPSELAIKGFEDLRLYHHDGHILASASHCSDSTLLSRMVEVGLGRGPDMMIRRLSCEKSSRAEKNWAPILSPSSDLTGWVYGWDPFLSVVSKENIDASCFPPHLKRWSVPPICRHFRGGSQWIDIDGDLVGLIHEHAFFPHDPKRRVYTHRLVRWSSPNLEISLPFRFQPTAPPHPHVEFCAGFCRVDERNYLISFGVDDATAWTVVITRSENRISSYS